MRGLLPGRRMGTLCRGVTLIEILVMASVVAIALLGAATLFPMSQSQIYRAADLSRAKAIARERLELLKNKGTTDGTVSVADCPPSTTIETFTVTCSQRDGTLDGLPATTAVVTILVGWHGPPSGSLTMSALVMRPE